MKRLLTILTALALVFAFGKANACTNFLITKGASADGSCMISYAADSHVLYGELYHYPAAACATSMTGTAAPTSDRFPKWPTLTTSLAT